MRRDDVRSALCSSAAALAVVAASGSAPAQDVLPGLDLFRTHAVQTGHHFSPTDLPAGFFGPGSDPFSELVRFQGVPLESWPGCTFEELDAIDTIFHRAAAAHLPSIPSQDIVPVEIVALELVSVNPITVTYGGQNPESWTVTQRLSPTAPTQGQMAITRTSPTGGFFDAQITVFPRFTFTNVANPSEVRILDFAEIGQPLHAFTVGSWPWTEIAPESCTSNFCMLEGGITILGHKSGSFAWRSYCPGSAVGAEGNETSSWGRVKSVYR